MLGKLFRHWVYINVTRLASAATGVEPYYKTKYSMEMQSPYWLLLRQVRMWKDGGVCQCSDLDCPHHHGQRGLVCTHRIGKGNRLQFHHLPGTKRLQGWRYFFRELEGCRMVCDKCHRN